VKKRQVPLEAALLAVVSLAGLTPRVTAAAVDSMNGEVYGAIGQRAKEQSPLKNTVIVTLANGRASSGYIPDDASFGAYTLEVLGSRLKPGCAEQGIADGIAERVRQYVGRQDAGSAGGER